MRKIGNSLFAFKYFIVLLSLTLLGIIPLLHSGLPPTHDGEYHIIRFYEFHKAFTDGDFYPRWAEDLNNDYGVPLFNFVYPFPNYIALLLQYAGFSFIDAFKLNLFLATVTGVMFFYSWTKLYWGELGGLVSAVSYAFAPYRFVDVYIRGSVGELWAMAFFPAFLWSITKLVHEKNRTGYVLTSGIYLALVIFSHNILAVMFALLAFSYCIFLLWQNHWRRSIALSFFASFFIGISLSAIFWLPALVESKYVRGLEIYSIHKNFPEVYQLLIPSWGSGFSGNELQNQMSFQIGIVPILVLFLSIITFYIFLKRKKKEYFIILFFLIWFFLTVFFMLRVSGPLWLNTPLFNYFQFPWRFLSITILCTSFLSGGVLSIFTSNKLRIIVAWLIVFLSVVLTIGYTKPAYYHNRDDNYYITRSNFIDGTNSPGNLFNTKWMKNNLPKQKEQISYLKGNGIYETAIYRTTYRRYLVSTAVDGLLSANIAYFPGWTVYQDGKEQKVEITKDGLLNFPIQKGRYIVEIVFLDTIIRKISNVWTFATVVLSLLFIVKKEKINKYFA